MLRKLLVILLCFITPVGARTGEPTAPVVLAMADTLEMHQPESEKIPDAEDREALAALIRSAEEEVIPSEEVTSLAEKITTWKRKVDRNIWFECGKRYSKEEIYPAALEWATAILEAQEKNTYMYRGKEIEVPLKDALGIIINESRFDRCAIGPYPRKAAYDKGILVKPEGSISHSLSELEALFTHPKFRVKNADCGPGQIVKAGGWDTIKDYFTLTPGMDLLFQELARRGKAHRTKYPSSRWPGGANHAWYTLLVHRQAEQLLK